MKVTKDPFKQKILDGTLNADGSIPGANDTTLAF